MTRAGARGARPVAAVAVVAAKVPLLACAIALSSAVATPAAGATAAPLSVVDDAGHRVELPRPARRVITLGPHLAELVHAAGGGASLVGVLRYSDYPPEVKRLPVVGDAFAINFEVVATLRPDLVIVWRSGVPERARQQLRALGVPVFESEIRHVDAIAASLRRFGTLLGSAETAARAADDVQRRWNALRATYAARRPVRVFYQLWPEPLMTVNREHLISEAIAACGGVNVFAALPGFTPTVSREAAVQADPQVIASAAEDDSSFDGWRRFRQVDAVRHDRFVRLDGDLIGRMGPRFVDGARALCEAIDAAR